MHRIVCVCVITVKVTHVHVCIGVRGASPAVINASRVVSQSVSQL